jgi:integrase
MGSEADDMEDDDDDESYPDPADAIRVLALLQKERTVFAACQLAADTGMRRGEVCALRFRDLDVGKGILRVRRTIVLGPGDKAVVQARTKTKTKRSIVLASSTLRMLSEHQSRVSEEAAQLGVTWSDDLFIFSSPGEPHLPMRPDLLTSRWRKACASVGVAMRLHDLRHLHATMLHLLGVDHERLTFRFGGRDMRLTDVHGNVVRPILTHG